MAKRKRMHVGFICLVLGDSGFLDFVDKDTYLVQEWIHLRDVLVRTQYKSSTDRVSKRTQRLVMTMIAEVNKISKLDLPLHPKYYY